MVVFKLGGSFKCQEARCDVSRLVLSWSPRAGSGLKSKAWDRLLGWGRAWWLCDKNEGERVAECTCFIAGMDVPWCLLPRTVNLNFCNNLLSNFGKILDIGVFRIFYSQNWLIYSMRWMTLAAVLAWSCLACFGNSLLGLVIADASYKACTSRWILHFQGSMLSGHTSQVPALCSSVCVC